ELRQRVRLSHVEGLPSAAPIERRKPDCPGDVFDIPARTAPPRLAGIKSHLGATRRQTLHVSADPSVRILGAVYHRESDNGDRQPCMLARDPLHHDLLVRIT